MTSPALTLTTQRQMTLAFIASDPTQVVLIPRVRALNASGAPVDTPGTPRPSQTVKLCLQNFDATPVATPSANLERQVFYHMVMAHDAQVAVWDYWMDSDGVPGHMWEVTAVSYGFGYETKAMVVERVPRTVVPG